MRAAVDEEVELSAESCSEVLVHTAHNPFFTLYTCVKR